MYLRYDEYDYYRFEGLQGKVFKDIDVNEHIISAPCFQIVLAGNPK